MPNFSSLEAAKASINTVSARVLRGALEPRLQSLAADGTNLEGAGKIDKQSTIVVVTGAEATKGIALPALADVELGKIYLIYVDGGTTSCELYPQTADAIQDGDEGDAHTIAVNTLQICFAASADKWVLLEAVGTAGSE